jgi:uncharacterized protein YdhG (YjbR/CyaY superfamily)
MQFCIEVDQYIQGFSLETQGRLGHLRNLIAEITPNAIEVFSYGMVGYKLNGKPLVYFGAFKNHIGVYALPKTHAAFTRQLRDFKGGKGSVQFPNSMELPMDLIRDMVLYRTKEMVNK